MMTIIDQLIAAEYEHVLNSVVPQLCSNPMLSKVKEDKPGMQTPSTLYLELHTTRVPVAPFRPIVNCACSDTHCRLCEPIAEQWN
jgi:hypothetical protein